MPVDRVLPSRAVSEPLRRTTTRRSGQASTQLELGPEQWRWLSTFISSLDVDKEHQALMREWTVELIAERGFDYVQSSADNLRAQAEFIGTL